MARIIFRFASRVVPLLLPFTLGSALASAAGVESALPVSPGDWQAGTPIADTCPNFSWGAVAGAQRYELAIFDAQWQDSPAYDDQLGQGQPVRHIDIAAPALSWTPAGADCLEEGGTYLWFVRAQTAAGEEGEWSAPRYFEIDYDSDALTQTVRRELSAQLSQPAVWREVIQAALTTNGSLRLTPLASRAVATAGAADGTGGAARPAGMGLANTPDTLASTAATFNPMALRISSTKGVVFDDPTATGGTPAGTGSIPASGAGMRFMWYPGKAALRSGYVSGSQWDDGNIGNYSTALGHSTTASGAASTAMGYSTTAGGAYATAIGWSTTASGLSSTALGFATTASGSSSTAMGTSTTASGMYAVATGNGTTASGSATTAMGEGTSASGDYSTAMGLQTTASIGSTAMGAYTTASGYYSTAMGTSTSASGVASTAMGLGTTASGSYAMALGAYTTASGYMSTAMGYGTTAECDYETVIGSFDTNFTPGVGQACRLFVIGNGTSYDSRSDALVVQRDGNLTISGQAYKPGGGSWAASSDARLKDVLGDYSAGLSEIAALRPVRFHYAVGNARGHDPAPEYVGFIAQQAQEVFPEAVSEGADGYLDFNMHAVNVAMVNAIQTLNEQNQVQQELILDLRSENAALVQRLASLEAENARLARLQADLSQIQAQMRVLQGQMAAAASHGQVALGR